MCATILLVNKNVDLKEVRGGWVRSGSLRQRH